MSEKVISYHNEIPANLHLIVENGDILKLQIIALDSLNSSEIVIDVKENGTVIGALADFASWNGKISVSVNLLGKGADCSFHVASLSSGEDKKIFETSVTHTVSETTALMSDYGISRDKSKIVFSGTSLIEKGAKKSSTRQEAKIIVFDETSDGVASPALVIKDNDVIASHAAVVGRLNEDHLFYLRSRGLSEEESKRIIALGYLKPIGRFFQDDDRNSLNEIIERRIADD